MHGHRDLECGIRGVLLHMDIKNVVRKKDFIIMINEDTGFS